MALTGGCLCGAIRYEIEGEPEMTVICHCIECQKQTGSSFSLVIGVKLPAFKILKGKCAIVETVGDSGTKTNRNFCNQCGSPILSIPSAFAGFGFVKAGTLDESSNLVPDMEVFCETAQNWCNLDGDWGKAPRNPHI